MDSHRKKLPHVLLSSMKNIPDLSLILPVFNEEDIITPVVKNIQSILQPLPLSYEILLVENESPDRSLQVITTMAKKDKRLRVVTTKKGYGSAILAGIRASYGKNVCYMPSDGQIDATVLVSLWQEFQTKKWDTVKIYRKNRESQVRFFRSKIFNLLSRILYPIRLRDINGSPRIVELTKLKKLNLQSLDSFIDVEFAIKAHYLHWNIKEIPMNNLNRLGGKSTVQLATVIEFIRNLINFNDSSEFLSWKENYAKISNQPRV